MAIEVDKQSHNQLEKWDYKPLPEELFIEESLIDGQGLFAAKEIAAETDLGITHYEVEKDAMSPKILIRTPLGGFINHSDTPNCQRSQIRVKPGFDKWGVMTLEDIEEGEELTLKYKLYDPEKTNTR